MDTLVKKAYDNWNQVVEYDGKSFLNLKQTKRSNASRGEVQMGQIDFPNTFNQQMPLPWLPATVPNEEPPFSTGQQVGGKCL